MHVPMHVPMHVAMHVSMHVPMHVSGQVSQRIDDPPEWDLVMASTCEILFVDVSLSDRDTILCSLRPRLQAMVLNADRSAASQMAAALAGRQGLEAVHVMTHGAPGQMNFSAGPWTVDTLEDEVDDLSAIGEALGPDRNLLLWSCHVGEGARGRCFVDALSRVTGAPVLAAAHLVGSPALGGRWDLSHRAPTVRPPLTDGGIEQYAGICATGPSGATGVLDDNYIRVVWDETSPAGTYFIVANDKGAQKVIGEFEIPPGGYKGRIFVAVNAQGSFIVAGDSSALNAEGSVGLCTRGGPTGDLGYHAATTSILGAAGTAVSSVSGPRRVGA
jgi:hypothetical protein